VRCLTAWAYTPEEVDTPHQASGSPAIQGYGVVLNMKLWGAVFVIWYLITAVLFYFTGYGLLSSLFWIKWVLNSSIVVMYVVSSLFMLLAGYFLRYWELSSWERGLKKLEKYLDKKESAIEEWMKDFKRLKAQREEYERSVRYLESSKSALLKEIERLSGVRDALKEEVDSLREEVEDLSVRIREAEERGYEEGYNRVMAELRSLRAQKSAILDAFDEYEDLSELFKKKLGMSIRRYLEFARKRVKEEKSGPDI